MQLRSLLFLFLMTAFFVACDDDDTTMMNEEPVMGTLAPNVGGADQPNQVYIDLSTKEMTVVDRSSWDFGFSSGASSQVILNGSNGMLAVATETTDYAAVSGADTSSFLGQVMNMDAIFGILIGGNLPPWFPQTSDWADWPTGDLSKTAIGEVSVDESDNKVYIVNRGKNPDGSSRGFIKLLVNQFANGYLVTYGDLDDPVGTTLEVEKDNEFNFRYVSVDDGIVPVQPALDRWDIAFSTYTDHVLSMFSSGFEVPYVVNDFVFTNRAGVEVATVTATGSTLTDYNAFGIDNVANINFNSDINEIGTTWRTVASPQIPGSVTAPVDDRFYVLRDASGRLFKLLFTQMTNENDIRGFPEFIYEEIEL